MIFSILLSHSLNWSFWPKLFLPLTKLCFVYLLGIFFIFIFFGKLILPLAPFLIVPFKSQLITINFDNFQLRWSKCLNMEIKY